MTSSENNSGTRAWWASIGLLAAGFLLSGYRMLREAVYPNWQDTEAYLGHSLYIAEHGGILGFLRDSFTGAFPITERHPLYMLMLAPFASRTADFFWIAKIINLALGLVALLTLIWMVQRRYGRGPALIAGVLYAFSSTLLVASAHVNHESLFTIFTLWTWWFLTEPTDPAVDGMPATRRWAIAGAFLGLAYLVKSPATLIGLAIFLAGLWYARLNFLTTPRFWVLLIATGVVSSPLVVRNLIGFGTPVYEGVNSNIMWLDDWSELGSERSVMHYDRYGIMQVDRNGLPTAGEYLQTHSVGSIAKRVLKGFYTEIFVVAPRALAPPFPKLQVIGQVWGFALLGLAVAGWWLRRKSWEAPFVFFWTGLFMLFFGWDHMFPEMRYLAPLVPIWLAYASFVMWTLAVRFLKPQVTWRVATSGVCAAMLLVSGWTIARGQLTDERPVLAENPSYAQLLDWMNANIVEGDRVLLGPTSNFYGLLWMVDRPVSVVETPSADNLDTFQRYLRERNVRYIVFNTDNARGIGGRLAVALKPYIEVSQQGEIIEKQPLPGWRTVHQDPSTPRRFIIYESELVAQRKQGAPAAPNPSGGEQMLASKAPNT